MASTTTAGLVKQTAALLTPGVASTSAFGVMKVGAGLTILSDGAGMPSITKLGGFTLGA